MDPSLPKVVVTSMADVDAAFPHYDLEHVQLHVDSRTSLTDAVQMHHRVRAGIRAADAFQLFNPEMLERKVEAEAALREAIDTIDLEIVEANEAVEDTHQKLVEVELALAPGPDAIRVGPSINRRAVDRDQVIFPSISPILMPGEGVAPNRRMTMTSKLRSRGLDAESQTAYWELNLIALQQKEALQAAYRDGLVHLREEFYQRAMLQPTSIGCGYSDYTFRF